MTPSILAHKNTLLASLRVVWALLTVRIIEHGNLDAPERSADAQARHQSAMQRMQLIVQDVTNRLSTLADAVHDADQRKRWFQAMTGIFRELKRPDALMSSFLVMLGWVVEAIFTTVALFADGHHDLIPALGFAVTFSTVNVGLGLSAGACLRYVGYRADSPARRPREVRTGRLALAGLLSVLTVDALMIFVGGRVRVTGDHHSIFDFSEVNFASTFGDGLALVIMVAAALSCAISAYKGYQGFSDPDPDYADYAGQTGADFNDDADDIVQSALERVDEVFEDAEDTILDDQEALSEQTELLEDLLRFNADVEEAKGEWQVFALAEWDRQSFIEGQEIAHDDLDTSEFDALLIDANALSISTQPQTPLDALRQAHGEAVAAIMTAFTEYAAAVQRFRVLPPKPLNTR